MLGPTFSALTGLKNSTKRLQNSANNLSNVTTSGFKKGKVNSIENKAGGSQVKSISTDMFCLLVINLTILLVLTQSLN